MKTIKHKEIIYILVAVVLLAGVSTLVWANDYLNKGSVGNYQAAEISCGHKPVIGSEESEGAGGKVYFEPASEDHRLMSKYDPQNLDMTSYTNPEFFCSVKEAEHAGYGKHRCCGFHPPSRN